MFRRRFETYGDIYRGLVMGFLFNLVMMTAVTLFAFYDYYTFDMVSTVGTVIDKQVTTRHQDGTDRTIYRVEYEFVTQTGRTYRETKFVSQNVYESLAENQPTTIYYEANSPTENGLQWEKPQPPLFPLYCSGIIALMLGLVIFSFMYQPVALGVYRRRTSDEVEALFKRKL